MIFNLQDASLSRCLPEQSPCRRSLWNRSCPGVAGGWDPASSLPSSLSPYLPLAFSPPRLNRTSLSESQGVPDSLPRNSPRSFRSFHPPRPLVFVFDELLAPPRTGNSKEGRSLRTQSTGVCSLKESALERQIASAILIASSFTCLSREKKRGLLSTARCENISLKESVNASSSTTT